MIDRKRLMEDLDDCVYDAEQDHCDDNVYQRALDYIHGLEAERDSLRVALLDLMKAAKNYVAYCEGEYGVNPDEEDHNVIELLVYALPRAKAAIIERAADESQ